MDAGMHVANYLLSFVMGLFALLLFMEALRPYKKFAGRTLKQSFATNTSAFVFNNIIMSLLSVSTLFVVADRYSGYGILSGLDSGPLKWILSFILFDFSVYVWHFIGHHSEALWRFHKIHHSDKSFHVTTGFRFHVFDELLEVIVKSLCAVAIGAEAKVVVVCEVVRMAFVLLHHSNLVIPGEKWLSYIFITPFLHRAHHSTLRSEHDSNYGIVLSIWDLIFRTRKEVVPEKIGLEMIEAENFVQLFCLAFITERRLARLLHVLPRRSGRNSN
jgi:sterol desaturase/sphingolipid hydroxylase (fatty acid hydroxylase superfamily)